MNVAVVMLQTKKILHLVLLPLLLSLWKKNVGTFAAATETISCEPLRVTECMSLGYNHTMLPNLVGMQDQVDAQHALVSFRPLLQYGCSSQLLIVLCGFYAPMCSPQVPGAVPPCQSLCSSVRDRCAPIMANFGYSWPSVLNCSRLPVENTQRAMCMEGPAYSNPPTSPATACVNCRCSTDGHDITVPFDTEDKEFASVWMAIWSVICCGVTLFTLISFIL